MEVLHIVLNDLDANLGRDKLNLRIGGTIFFVLGETYFPEEGWYDLVSVDLENWIPGILSFARNHTDACELRFMDGPAVVKLKRHGADVFASCIYNQMIEVDETKIDLSELITSVIQCLRRYHRLLHERGLSPRFTNEIAALQACI